MTLSIVFILVIIAVGLCGFLATKPAGWVVVALAGIALLFHVFGMLR